MRRDVLWAALIVVVGVFAIFGLLYAYRSQAPAAKEVPYSLAVTQVEQGAVHSVVISGARARIALRDGGQIMETAVPERDEALARAVNDWNRANPSRSTQLKYEQESGSLGLIGSVILSLLPIVLLGVLVLMAARQLVRARSPDRYEALLRIADLRDRGVLSEDEFQKEKRRILE